MQMDRATLYSVMGKGWQIVAGPITLLLIAQHLDPEAQGFYYTFISLVALQSFVELGFFIVITQFASHEWAHLKLNADGFIEGDANSLSRLVSLGRIVFKWYAVASTIFVVLVGAGGYLFLSQESPLALDWEWPWLFYIMLSGLELWIFPFLALLEGCGQISNVYLFRLYRTVIKSLVLWLILFLGGELWLAAGEVGVSTCVFLTAIFLKYKNFFTPFISLRLQEIISWKKEIWPMQWRLAAGGIGTYLVTSIYTPVIFHYHGAKEAGQIGMTLQLTSAVEAIALTWIITKVPQLGVFVAKKKWRELDQLFFKASGACLGIALLGSFTLWSLIYGINIIDHPLAQRVLPPLGFAIFLAGNFLVTAVVCAFYYMRAHKQEPIVLLNVLNAILNGSLVWYMGSRFGSTGAATAYLISTVILLFPFSVRIFIRFRKNWHRPEK